MEKINKEPKKTIGQHVIEMYNKKADTPYVVEKMKQQSAKWNEVMQNCYDVGTKGLPNRDFYIVVLLKHEIIFGDKVWHLLPFVRPTCPSPEYDQTVFKYHHKVGTPEFLWCLPDKETYDWYVENASIIHPDRWGLLKFVLMDKSGVLLKKAKILNGESFLEEVRPEI